MCVCVIQVLSTSVAKALEYYKDLATKETERFCLMFDHYSFDCLNVRAYTEGRKKRKPDLLSYRTIKDTRFNVIREFLVIGTNLLCDHCNISYFSGLKMISWDIWLSGTEVFLIELELQQHRNNR